VYWSDARENVFKPLKAEKGVSFFLKFPAKIISLQYSHKQQQQQQQKL